MIEMFFVGILVIVAIIVFIIITIIKKSKGEHIGEDGIHDR
ncbi:hypothetical protein SAMN05660816_06442 [Niastella yeongjuensis]|nr:hypothetical protein SAMN05660816_06442 [Niastella yeongjuensis]